MNAPTQSKKCRFAVPDDSIPEAIRGSGILRSDLS
jgi:hypothetical protein